MSRRYTSGFHKAAFQETHWSLVLKAGRQDEGGVEALNHLCRAYWRPLYSYVRRRNFTPADSEDLIQGFFHDLIEREALQTVDREKGRFRSFLLGSLQNFLANERDRQQTWKRGGRAKVVSFDELQAEESYGELGAPELAPERIFDRAWALAILQSAWTELREEYAAKGQVATFEALEPVLSKDGRTATYSELAAKLGCTEVAVRMAASRLTRRFGKILRREVGKTVADPAEVDDELQYLLSCG